MGQVNVQFVYGAGSDDLFGGGLRALQTAVKDTFQSMVYSPRIIDYTEYSTLLRLLRAWKDPTILVGHSCGCNPITAAAVELSMEPIPYLMAIAPSMYCSPWALPPNVRRATQASSWAWDFFNPGSRMLLKRSPINSTTVLDSISTGASHLNAPYSAAVRERLLVEVNRAINGA